MATQRETIIFYVGVGACLPFRAQTTVKISFSLEMLVDHYRMEYIDIGMLEAGSYIGNVDWNIK